MADDDDKSKKQPDKADKSDVKLKQEEMRIRAMVDALKGVFETTEDPFKRLDEIVDGFFKNEDLVKFLNPSWRTKGFEILKASAVSLSRVLTDAGINPSTDVSNLSDGNAAADVLYGIRGAYEKWRMEKKAEAKKNYADAIQKVVDVIAKGINNPKGNVAP